MVDDHKGRGAWKIQLTMRISVSFTDANETRVVNTKSDNIKIMSGIESHDAINELFNENEGKQFYIRTLEFHLHKISLNRGSSYIKSPESIKNKGVTINPRNTKNHMSFQYALTAA